MCVCVLGREEGKWKGGREERWNRVQRGEAGGREGWRGSAVKDAWSPA